MKGSKKTAAVFKPSYNINRRVAADNKAAAFTDYVGR